ncbi:MAG: cytochrome P450 [Steroidobacteraceae bacterium]
MADEMVRWVTPVKHFFRTATQDYVLRGQQIKAGDGLMLSFVAANRDEDVFDSPFSFKVDRTPNPHLGFGHGAHSCVGLHLAKMEIRALFREILQRFDSIELDGEPAWLAVTLSGGLKQLPIRYKLR